MERRTLVKIGLVVLACLVAVGIVAVQLVRENPWVKTPTAFSDAGVAAFCGTLSRDLQSLSYLQMTAGWLLVAAAVCSGVLGSILGPVPTNSASVLPATLRPYRGFLLVALASVLTAGGMQVLDRAAHSSEAAAQATLAFKHIGIDDRKAYDACVDARGAWLSSRKDMQRVSQMLEILKQENPVSGSDETVEVVE